MTKSRATQITDWRTVERKNVDSALHQCFYVIFLVLSQKAYGCVYLYKNSFLCFDYFTETILNKVSWLIELLIQWLKLKG